MPKRESSKTTGKTSRRGQATPDKGRQEEPARGEAVFGAPPETKTSPLQETPQPEMTTGPAPTHDEVAERAKAIWEQRGHPQGQDVEIWAEAEQQLHEEMMAGHKT